MNTTGVSVRDATTGAHLGARLAAVILTISAALGCLAPPSVAAQAVLVDAAAFQAGALPERWLTGGPRCMEMPEWQVHEYNPTLYILRQSGCTDFEKPFLYLLFGTDRALLLDTGSRQGNLAPTLQRTVHRWLTRMGRTSIPLLVLHTHGHGDHVAGDAGLLALHDPVMPVTLIAADVAVEKEFLGISQWPEEVGRVDLGDRLLDVLSIPGHADTSLAFYDRQTALLFTGDSLYPGRLYVRDLPAFRASTERLVRFTEGKPVAHILGNHIEQTRTPYQDYATGTIYQPNEHGLALSRGALLELEVALLQLHDQPAKVALADFTIWPKPVEEAEKADEQQAFEKTQHEQLGNQWDQPHF